MRIKTVLLFALAFIALLTNEIYAATVTVRTSTGVYVTKEVTSVRELRFKDVVPQKYDFSCGAASIATILKYAFKMQDVHEEEIVNSMIENGSKELIKKKGFSLLDIKKYAERKGFSANGYKLDKEKLSHLKIPGIVLLNSKGYEHFVVLKGVKNGKVYLADPAMGNRSTPINEFLETWNGVVFAVYKKTDQDIIMKQDVAFSPEMMNILPMKDINVRHYTPLPGEF